MAFDQSLLRTMEWRCIGPPRGGRVVAVTGDPADPMTFYFGACAGGVWKSDDGGAYWQNVSDGYFKTAAVGAIAVAESDPNVVYAGMGESCIRTDVSHGDGVYRSSDAGRSWSNIGLQNTRHISRVRVHPKNPDLVYVAALGHAWGPNPERGIFRSNDGGQILGPCPLQGRHNRCCRPFPGPQQPPDNVRRPLASPALIPGHCPAAAPVAASTARPTADLPGRMSPDAPVSPKASWAA